MKRIFHITFVTILLLTASLSTAFAHRLQPAYLEINEQSAGKFSILWKRPFVGSKPMNIDPRLPSKFRNLTEPVVQLLPTGAVERWMVASGEGGLASKIFCKKL